MNSNLSRLNQLTNTHVNKQTMSNPTTVKPTNFDSNNVEASEPRTRKGKDGVERLLSFIRYDGKPMWLETPWLKAPFGVSSFNKGDTGNVDWSVNLSAQPSGLDSEELITQFFDNLRGMEKALIAFGVKNSQTIFGEEHPEAVVSVLFNRFVKQDKEKKYAPRFSPKIPRVRSRGDEEVPNRPYIEFFRGGSSEPVDLDSFEQLANYVPKGSCVRALISPRIYFVSGKFGVSWDVISMKAQSSSTSRPSGLGAFSDETAEEFVERTAAAEAEASSDGDAKGSGDEATKASPSGSGGDADGTGDASEEEPSEEEDSSEDEEEEEEA